MNEKEIEEGLSCPVYKKCGACQLDVCYPRQLNYKMRLMREFLGRYGKIDRIIGMDDPYNYRCKVSVAFGFSKNRVISGVWQSAHGKLVQCNACALEDKKATPIINAIQKLLPKFKLRTYDEKTKNGFLRFVIIRVGKQSGEILVALGTNSGEFAQLGDFAKALIELCPEISTLVRCVSLHKLNLLLGSEETVLYGKGYISDFLCGREFQISARSFFQVNPIQTEKLYSTAVKLAELNGTETVIDAYCGVGTIGIIAASGAKRVIAAELNHDAVKNAKKNVEINKIKNMDVFECDAGDFMTEMANEGQKAEVVFTDPPRAGCSKEFLNSLIKLSPEKIIYISCNPETQARDLRTLVHGGYAIKKIQPVDMFPFTKHIESIVCLKKKTIKS